MNEYEFLLTSAIDDPWRSMKPLVAGDGPRDSQSFLIYITVTRNKEPWVRIDLYEVGDENGKISDVQLWEQRLLIGLQKNVYCVNLDQKLMHSETLGVSFNAFFPHNELMLVSTDGGAAAFDVDGRKRWENCSIALSWARIDSIKDGRIHLAVTDDLDEPEELIVLDLRSGARLPMRNG